MERPAFIVASLLGLTVLGGGLWPRPQPADPTRLRIESLPGGAEVLLDKARLGTTPLEVSVDPGEHQLSLNKAGFNSLRQSVNCPTGRVTALSLRLAYQPATLTVRDSQDAELWLGPGTPEKLSGKGPWTLEPGEYELTAKKGPLPAIPEKFRLKPGEKRVLSLQWPQAPLDVPGRPLDSPATAPPPPVQAPPASPPPAQPIPQWRPPPIARPEPPRAFSRPQPPAFQPEPLWTPLPAAPAEPVRVPPSEGLFTPLP